MKKTNYYVGNRAAILVVLVNLLLFTNAIAQYAIVINGPADICGVNNTYLSVNPAPTGLTVNWYKNNINTPGFPYATGPILQSPETGNWTCEVVTSTIPFLQSVFTQTVQIRTNQIYIESPIATTSCVPLTIDENASNVAMLAFYDFYQWKKNGVSIPGANSYTYNASTTGVYTCQANLSCGTGLSNPLNLTFENPPSLKTITASGALTFCQGGSVQLSIPPTAGLSYQWRRNSIDIPGATGTSYTVTQSGTYNCREISMSCGYINSTSKTIVVNPLPTAAVVTANGPTTFCLGGSVLLSGNANGGVWSIGGGTTATLLASTSGDYYLTNSNACGSVTSNHLLVSTNALPTVSISGLASVYNCMDAPVVLSGNPSGGVFSGSGVLGTTFNPKQAGAGGPYAITYSYTNSFGCSASAIAQTSVNALNTCAVPQHVAVSQIAKKTAVISWDGSAAPSFKVRYRKTGTSTYLYKNVSFTPCSPTSVQLTGLISNTSYTVDVKAVCSNLVTSYSAPVTFKTLISNPALASAIARETETGVDLIDESEVMLFPNPFEHFIEIQPADFMDNSSLQISTISGKIIYETKLTSATGHLIVRTEDWLAGMYFVQVASAQRKLFFKIIKN